MGIKKAHHQSKLRDYSSKTDKPNETIPPENKVV